MKSDNQVLDVEEVSNNKEYPWSRVVASDNTEKAIKLKTTAYSNEFTYRKNMSRIIELDNVKTGPHFVGQYVNINGIVDGVVVYVAIPIQIQNETVRFKVKVACQGLLEQK